MRGKFLFLFLGLVSLGTVACLVAISFFRPSPTRLSFNALGLPGGVPVTVYVEGKETYSLVSDPLGCVSFVVDASRWDSVILLVCGRRYDLTGRGNTVSFAGYLYESGGFWECVAASACIVLFSVGWFYDFNLLGEICVGLVIGFIWELLTRSWWFYHGNQFVVGGIPVATVIWWGFNLALASFVSQLVFAYSGYNFSRGRGARVLVYMMVVGLVCIPMEFFGWYVLDLWDYLWTPFWFVACAWFSIGTLMLVAIDFLNTPFERLFSFVPVVGR